MQSWQARLDRRPGRPLYHAIADAIADAVAGGELRPGDRLPPHRTLAAELDIDLTTASRGYAEARRRGLLSAGVGRGTYIRADPAPRAGDHAGGRTVIDLSMNLPPQPADPSLRRLLQDGLTALLRRSDMAALMAYRAGAGTAAEREAAADWLRPVTGPVDPGRVLVCPGAQSALTALLAVLARPGDTILTEPLIYPGFLALAAQMGLRLAPVAADAEGMLPEALDRACRERRPKAIYCIPTMQNPTAVTMPAPRRQEVAGIARAHGVPVIEDDAYGLLPSAPLPAITTLAPGYYLATTSKCLTPGLRIAHVVAPDAVSAEPVAAALRATSQMPAPLMAGLLATWLRDGTAAAWRDAVREEAAARQRIAAGILPPGSFAAHPEGLHLWLTLPAQWNRMDFWAHASRQGLALVPSDSFLVAPGAPNAVRISLGAAASADALRTALHEVVRAMRRDAAPPAAIV